jgi:hypothetical protein
MRLLEEKRGELHEPEVFAALPLTFDPAGRRGLPDGGARLAVFPKMEGGADLARLKTTTLSMTTAQVPAVSVAALPYDAALSTRARSNTNPDRP